MKERAKQEILAPAGSIEQLKSAVNNGCDSVYLGLESFNARMKAPNFTRENLAEWVDFCHFFGVKVYVAINTSLKNEEMQKAVDLLKYAYKSNADGVIVTDLSLMGLAATLPKPFDVVASTQLNIHGKSGALFALKQGATTVVCARECSLDDIKDIVETGVETECFVHGATCVCQSGQCLFSSMVGGNSGNRGLCAQPCRKLYSAVGKPRYLLSARDLCGLDTAKILSENGVHTFKIEGRNRRAEYAGITSRVYRKLFDNDFAYSEADEVALKEAYNRDMSRLSYLDGGNDNIISPMCQSHSGVPVGQIFKNKIKADVPIEKGDGFKVFFGGVEMCGGVALESGMGLVDAEFGGTVFDGEEVRRTTSVRLNNDVNGTRRLLPVSLRFVGHVGEQAFISASCNGVTAEVTSEFVLPEARTNPTSDEEISKQLQKIGETYYTICDIAVETDNIFLAKSQINALRREVLEKLSEKIIANYNKPFENRKSLDLAQVLLPKICKKEVSPRIAVTCFDENQLNIAAKQADIVIYKPSILDAKAFEIALEQGAYLDLPSYATKYIFEQLRKTPCNIVCNNIGQVQWARTLGLEYIAGAGLNIFNDWMAAEFADAKTFVYSLELSLAEISHFANKSGLIFADGEICLMKLIHCPYKLNFDCTCGNCQASKKLVYRDEQKNEFYFRRRREQRCTFELVNGKKLSAAARLKKPCGYLIDFDAEILAHYKNLNNGVADGYVERRPYTKGRLFDKIN